MQDGGLKVFAISLSGSCVTASLRFENRRVEFHGRSEISRVYHKVSAQNRGTRGRRMRTEEEETARAAEQEEAEYESWRNWSMNCARQRQDHVAILNQAKGQHK